MHGERFFYSPKWQRTGMTYLSDEQVSLLLKPIHPNRVANLRGLSYIEGYDCRAELTRVFGFGRWSEETLDQQLICERETTTSKGGKAWYVVYRTRVRLTIHAPDGTYLTFFDGAHVGESTHPVQGEAHGNALTNSQTYALRRCAINLGDQFGLSLYNKGSLEPVVRWTLVRPESVSPDTDDVPVISPETPEFTAENEPQAPAESKSVQRRKAVVKAEPLTLEELVMRISDASTVDKLRGYFKEAASAGMLKDEIAIPGTGEKITIEGWLFRRSDELGAIKSTPGDQGDPGEDSGAE